MKFCTLWILKNWNFEYIIDFIVYKINDSWFKEFLVLLVHQEKNANVLSLLRKEMESWKEMES